MEKSLTIPIYFRLIQFSPDQRQYKTASPIFEPVQLLYIVIDVPLKHEYIYNIESIIQSQISASDGVAPLLTLLGWAFIEDAFLARTDKTQEEKQSENDIKWEDDPKE